MKIAAGIIRLLSWVVYIIIGAALLINVPIAAGYRPVVILSGSMKPAYPVGSITYYKQADFADIKVGDAITMRLGENSLATHRVIEKHETSQEFITKGDNNPSADNEPVTYNRVVGKAVKGAIPQVGYFIKYIQNWYAIGILGLILLLDMFLGGGRSSKKRSGQGQEKPPLDSGNPVPKKQKKAKNSGRTSPEERFRNL